MQKALLQRYFFGSLLLVSVGLVVIILRPFLAEMAVGMSLAVALFPAYRWLQRRKIPNWIAAFIVVLGFVAALGYPIYMIGTVVFEQSKDVYHSLVDNGQAAASVETANNLINRYLPDGVTIDLKERALDIVGFLTTHVTQVFTYTLATVFSIFITLFVLYYSLKDGETWLASAIDVSPLTDRDDRHIADRLAQAVNGVIKGYLLIALLQGILMSIGLSVFGVPNPMLWGVIAAVASLIPTIGTSLISIPAVIYLFATGHVAEAIGLLAWAALIVGTIDNILNPIVVGKNIQIPPIFILLAVLGGIELIGPVGILIGPLAVSLLHTLIRMYQENQSKAKRSS